MVWQDKGIEGDTQMVLLMQLLANETNSTEIVRLKRQLASYYQERVIYFARRAAEDAQKAVSLAHEYADNMDLLNCRVTSLVLPLGQIAGMANAAADHAKTSWPME